MLAFDVPRERPDCVQTRKDLTKRQPSCFDPFSRHIFLKMAYSSLTRKFEGFTFVCLPVEGETDELPSGADGFFHVSRDKPIALWSSLVVASSTSVTNRSPELDQRISSEPGNPEGSVHWLRNELESSIWDPHFYGTISFIIHL